MKKILRIKQVNKIKMVTINFQKILKPLKESQFSNRNKHQLIYLNYLKKQKSKESLFKNRYSFLKCQKKMKMSRCREEFCNDLSSNKE